MKKWLAAGAFIGMILLGYTTTAQATYFEDNMKEAPFWYPDTRIEKVPDYSYDYYRIQLEKDSYITFTLDDPSKGKADILLSILEDNGSTHGRDIAHFRSTEEDGDINQTVEHIQLRAGTYYIRIDGPDKEGYNAIYSISPLKTSIDLEPNDSIAQANPIMLNSRVSSVGSIYDDEDFYSFTIDKPSKVILETEAYMPKSFSNLNGRLYMEVFDERGRMYLYTMSSQTWSDDDLEMLLPGKYFVKIRRNGSSYNPYYHFTIHAEEITHPETFKNSLFGTTLLAGQEVRGFLSHNDEYFFTLDHEQKVKINVWTDSPQRISGTLHSIDTAGNEKQILNRLTYEYQNGLLTITVFLQPGNYLFEPSTLYSQTDEVNYTVKFAEVTYKDIPEHYRYYQEIMSLSTKGIINGYNDGTFLPTKAITRRQVFTMLSRYDGLQLSKVRDMIPFKDLKHFSTDHQLIYPFYEAGIIDGNNGRMNLSSQLTRAQLAKILVNTFDLKLEGEGLKWKDVSPAHGSYKYIQILASHGITLGDNGNYMPNKPVSREHFSVFLDRTLLLVNK